jgi:hypothetical protein
VSPSPVGLPVLRALLAQIPVLVVLALAARLGLRLPPWAWVLTQGLGAALLARVWGLGPWWLAFQALLPLALAWQLGHTVPGWVYPALLGGLLLVFGGGLLTRVPLYNSTRGAWQVLLEQLPAEAGLRMVDLGAGLGGPLAHLASRRPDARFTGVEASPLVWCLGWLRTRPWRGNCAYRLGSLWRTDLAPFQVAFAFLSPPPMAALWAKASREMAPGSLLLSHSFEVPDVLPERRIPVPGRGGACLLVYRIGGRNQDPEGGAERQGGV